MTLDILVVDDRSTGEGYKELLPLKLNCRVDIAYDTQVAFHMVEDKDYSLMIIDPSNVGYVDRREVVTGAAACVDLMTLGLKTLVLTADFACKERLSQAGLRKGYNYQAYFEKPLRCDEIVTVIEKLTIV